MRIENFRHLPPWNKIDMTESVRLQNSQFDKIDDDAEARERAIAYGMDAEKLTIGLVEKSSWDVW